jgi:peptide/nickel transport system substrate-binding protein
MSRAVLGRLLIVALVFAAAAPLTAQPLQQSNVLRVGLPAVPVALDPATGLDGPVPFIARQVFDTLVRHVEGSSDIEPGLAVQWSVSKNGLTWSFRLRDGMRFHDGTALTAQHVVQSLERLVQPGHAMAPTPNAAAPHLLRGTPGVVKDIRATAPHTVQIALVLPYAPLLNVLAHPAFSIVLASAAVPGAPLQGTGPFAVAEIGPGRVVLDARGGHWAGGPRVDHIVFSEVPDEAQAVAALDAQALDVFFPAGAPPRQSGAVSVPGWQIGYLALQTDKEPFSRVKNRRAVATALDPAVLSLATGAAASPLQGFLPSGVWGRREARTPTAGDGDAAKRLFAEGGMRPGMAPTLLVAESDRRVDMARVAEAVRASLAAADLPITVQAQPRDVALPVLQAGEHVMALLEARVEAGDPHFLLYPLSTTEGAAKGPHLTNFSLYRNARLDDLLIRASQLSFRPERQRLYARAQAMLAEELPWIPLYVRRHWAVARPEVRGLRLHPGGNHRLDRVMLDAAPR